MANKTMFNIKRRQTDKKLYKRRGNGSMYLNRKRKKRLETQDLRTGQGLGDLEYMQNFQNGGYLASKYTQLLK